MPRFEFHKDAGKIKINKQQTRYESIHNFLITLYDKYGHNTSFTIKELNNHYSLSDKSIRAFINVLLFQKIIAINTDTKKLKPYEYQLNPMYSLEQMKKIILDT